ncbi:rCG41748, isoform CRA_a [Rattus norvegicus]|uniref:RCG41748, isoform CRA_a n=1 Tax=Rattus norvegicus TaxID=10116 RepID=A6KU62_RAT|nr:rCG41748, isoform CRA_a [Rattus norvegicus]
MKSHQWVRLMVEASCPSEPTSVMVVFLLYFPSDSSMIHQLFPLIFTFCLLTFFYRWKICIWKPELC